MSKEFLKRICSSIILLPLTFYIIIVGNILFNIFIIVCLLITLFEWNKFHINLILKLSGNIFIIYSFYSVFNLRNFFPEEEKNIFFFILVLSICIFTDIGGYTFGKILKGPKLTNISPNKTYAGLLGGFIFSVLFCFLYFNPHPLKNFYLELDKTIIIYTIVISGVSQFGDLIISYFKRKSNFKDTGNLIPGHGGILDRIDGVIFAFPFVNLSINFLNF